MSSVDCRYGQPCLLLKLLPNSTYSFGNSSSPSKVGRQGGLTQVVEVGVHLADSSILFALKVERGAGAARESRGGVG